MSLILILYFVATFFSHSRVEAMGTEAIRSIRDQVSDSPILPQPEVIIPGLSLVLTKLASDWLLTCDEALTARGRRGVILVLLGQARRPDHPGPTLQRLGRRDLIIIIIKDWHKFYKDTFTLSTAMSSSARPNCRRDLNSNLGLLLNRNPGLTLSLECDRMRCQCVLLSLLLTFCIRDGQ